jgi:hypothetical protein
MEMWEAGLMVLLYATYVCLTFYISRHDEPVHADVARHEVPQQEGVGEGPVQPGTALRLSLCCCPSLLTPLWHAAQSHVHVLACPGLTHELTHRVPCMTAATEYYITYVILL